jgi:hypothetical protein
VPWKRFGLAGGIGEPVAVPAATPPVVVVCPPAEVSTVSGPAVGPREAAASVSTRNCHFSIQESLPVATLTACGEAVMQ